MDFKDYASTWWDLHGPLKTLHAINNARMFYIQQHITMDSSSILDVGCGGGIVTEALAKNGALVWGIDLEEALVEAAKKHALQEDLTINYEACTLSQFKKKYSSSAFEAVLMLELLEHVADKDELIATAKSLLAPHGKLFFATINRTISSLFFAKVAAEYLLRLLPIGTHSYQDFIKPHEMQRLMQRHGLEIQGLSGIQYNPISNSAQLSKNLNINYIGYATCN